MREVLRDNCRFVTLAAFPVLRCGFSQHRSAWDDNLRTVILAQFSYRSTSLCDLFGGHSSLRVAGKHVSKEARHMPRARIVAELH